MCIFSPTVLITVPSIRDFAVPTFDIMKPEVGPNTRSIKTKGNCTLVVVIGSPPKPTGGGFLTSIGMV